MKKRYAEEQIIRAVKRHEAVKTLAVSLAF